MHFCPRPACRKSYHRSCLANDKFRDKDKDTRSLRLLTSSPDTDEVFSLSSLVSGRPRKRRPGIPDPSPSPSTILEALPPDLVKVAQQPIVKGIHYGGVVGNVKAVITARRVIYAAIETLSLPQDWETQIGVSTAIPKKVGKTPLPPLLCPQCRGPI